MKDDHPFSFLNKLGKSNQSRVYLRSKGYRSTRNELQWITLVHETPPSRSKSKTAAQNYTFINYPNGDVRYPQYLGTADSNYEHNTRNETLEIKCMDIRSILNEQ